MINNSIQEISQILENDTVIYSIMKQCPYEILKNIQIKSYNEGKILLRQGEICEYFYIVISGTFAIYVMSQSGKRYTFVTYDKGMCIGELEIMDNKPCVSTVEAISDVRILEIKRSDYLKWIDLDKNFNNYLLKTMCQSTYVLCENTSANTLYSLRKRVCIYLVEHVNGMKDNKNKLKINTDMLSEYMGVTIRSINRILKQLKEEEIIKIENPYIIIKNLELLKKELNCNELVKKM